MKSDIAYNTFKLNLQLSKALIIIIFLHALTTGNCLSQGKGKELHRYYTVTKIVDGDTFWIDDDSGKGLKIRLIGVDTPESRNTGNKVKAYYGAEASEYLSRLIAGKKVRLEYDVDRFDRYDRTLAYVYLEDGTFVNADLLRKGYAMIMTVPPNVKHADKFLKLSQKARRQNRGLWGR